LLNNTNKAFHAATKIFSTAVIVGKRIMSQLICTINLVLRIVSWGKKVKMHEVSYESCSVH